MLKSESDMQASNQDLPIKTGWVKRLAQAPDSNHGLVQNATPSTMAKP